jgi:iron complex transport system ATP-binding protein
LALIDLQRLSFNARLKQVDFSVNAGELVGLIGANGAGKSSLIELIAGLHQGHGEIFLNQQRLSEMDNNTRAQRIAYQPQQNQSAWPISVFDLVSLGRIPWMDENQEIIEQAIKATGVESFKHRAVSKLSSGERARVWLARLLAGQPNVILADELIANLDLHFQIEVMSILKEYVSAQGLAGLNHQSTGKSDCAVILAIHDLSLAARFCDKLCLLHHGEVLAYGSPSAVLREDLLYQAYGIKVDVDLDRYPPTVMPL